MVPSLIESEFIKRKYVGNAIELYIGYHFEFDPKKKLRRGSVQKEISDVLGITKNNVFSMLVNDAMERLGFKKGEIRGNYVYKNVKRK